jgi:hypothetical protein
VSPVELTDVGGQGGGEGAKSYDGETAWSLITHSILSAVHIHRWMDEKSLIKVCILDFADDLEFWMIKELNLEICCLDKFNARLQPLSR